MGGVQVGRWGGGGWRGGREKKGKECSDNGGGGERFLSKLPSIVS